MSFAAFLFISLMFVLCSSLCAADEIAQIDPVQVALGLDSDTYRERHQSTVTLRRLGRKAHPAIIDAAGRSAEARTRALGILEEQFESTDVELQSSAKAALEELAQRGGPAGRRAQYILSPPAPPTINPAVIRMRAMQIRAMQIQGGIQIGGAPQMAPAVRRYSITLNENGRTIRLRGSENGIEMEVTETNKDGRKVTNKYQAKNAAELKANHPEAHAIYDNMRKKFGLRDPNP